MNIEMEKIEVKSNYRYKVYGMNINSDVEILQFIPLGKEICQGKEVNIKLSDIPTNIKESFEKEYIKVGEDWIAIKSADVGYFYITNGNTVLIELLKEYNKNTLRNYIMGSIMGFLLLQRQVIAIHGGTIAINDGAVIITGDSGAGKSTLTVALGEKGYKFLADDIAAVELDSNYVVNHGFPYHKLCKGEVDKRGLDPEDFIKCMGAKEMKYVIPDYHGFCRDTLKLRGICEVSVEDIDAIKILKLKGGEKIAGIIKNIYRGGYINDMGGFSHELFKKYFNMSKEVKYYKIIRPSNKNTVSEIIENIEQIFQ